LHIDGPSLIREDDEWTFKELLIFLYLIKL